MSDKPTVADRSSDVPSGFPRRTTSGHNARLDLPHVPRYKLVQRPEFGPPARVSAVYSCLWDADACGATLQLLGFNPRRTVFLEPIGAYLRASAQPRRPLGPPSGEA